MSDIISILDSSGTLFDVFGFTESRLSSVLAACDVTIPGLVAVTKDPTHASATGLLIHIYEAVTYKRLTHLEDDSVEAV